ncbi:hypothetical protein C8R45DRAFT_290416 [Mycena sanguinolenta]|nr:hypothetical protein C8R45DRAFT_290416 [Mycena sanguinolenta]
MDADIRAEVLLVEESTAVRRRSGDFFPKSKQFTIAGGVFTSNVTNNFPQSPGTPSDFRMIPLGDIDLQREIRLDVGLGVLDRRRERACIRRVYSAKVEGKTSEMTVTTYQGDTAEEEWTQGVSILSSLRYHAALDSGSCRLNLAGAQASQYCPTLWHDEYAWCQWYLCCGLPRRSGTF